MTAPHTVASPSVPHAAGPWRGALAQALQEPFTVAVRLRGGQTVATSSESFRERIRPLITEADREARRLGYASDDARAAVYAFIAFLDESVMNSTQPMFANWSRRPLQEEIFGDLVAGDVFFQRLGELMARQDDPHLGDVLEIYLLCLLLGFRGRYSTNPEALTSVAQRVRERIDRIRGPLGALSPHGGIPASEVVPERRDPWIPRLIAVALGIGAVALLLFIGFRLGLGSQLSGLAELAREVAR